MCCIIRSPNKSVGWVSNQNRYLQWDGSKFSFFLLMAWASVDNNCDVECEVHIDAPVLALTCHLEGLVRLTTFRQLKRHRPGPSSLADIRLSLESKTITNHKTKETASPGYNISQVLFVKRHTLLAKSQSSLTISWKKLTRPLLESTQKHTVCMYHITCLQLGQPLTWLWQTKALNDWTKVGLSMTAVATACVTPQS